jgi:glycine/D-amino acid oxidase-like deaminating enzyme
MTEPPSVVVVGAGAIGLCTAFELHELGVRDITVLEKRHVASASSGLAVGIIETQYLDPVPIAIRVYSMDFFGRLEREAGLPITRNGYLRLAHRPEELEAYARSVAIQHELGVADAVVLDRAGVQERAPDMVCDDVLGGLFGPSDGFVDPALTCNLIADLLRKRGVTIAQQTELVGATRAPDRGHVLQTTAGDLRCDHVVNAAGAWATPVGELLGAPATVRPERHQALFVRLPEPLPYVMPSVMDYVPGSGREGLYFRHDTPTSLVAGLHTEDPIQEVVDPDRYRRGGDDLAYMTAVGEQLAERLPAFADAGLDGVWAGIYPISPDGEPSIGPYRDAPTVQAAFGGGGSGFQSAPGIGRSVAEWVVHGEPRTVPGVVELGPDRASLAAAG